MEVRLLGPLEVRVGGHVVPIRRGRPRKLFIALVLRAGERVSADALIDALWGDAPPQNAVNALQVLVSYLRKALVPTRGAAAIETVDAGYRLVLQHRESVDAFRLEDVIRSWDDIEGPAERLRRVDEVLEGWHGPALPEVAYDQFAQPEIQRLTELRIAAHERRVDGLMQLGRHGEASVELQRLVGEHPLHEHFYAQLMTALYRSGRQAEALEVYERARTALVEELGLDPGPELRALEAAILAQAPELQGALVETSTVAPPASEPSTPARSDSTAPKAPAALESLIGRENEVHRLLELTGDRRMVTLTGPGGAGKTRLAIEVAARTSQPAWWVDVAPVATRSELVAAVAASMNVSTKPGDDEHAVAAALRDRAGVLVLDTCERMRSDVRAVVEAVLVTCPEVRVFATSRQPIGAPTELAWPVPPLSLPDPATTSRSEISAAAAVQLFVERAADRRPDFSLTDDNCTAVAKVCWLLDGLPLAIELAAAQAGVLGVDQMVRILDDRLRLPIDEDREDRQRTLRSTIGWSYELLSPEEATFFERLSVFAAPFPLEAGVVVAGTDLPADGLNLLLSLARQSLVAVEGSDHYRLLDTIRAYGQEQLSGRADDLAATQRRHAQWYLEFAEEAERHLRGVDVEGWLEDLRLALPDLRRAVDWWFSAGEVDAGVRMVSALSWFWAIDGAFEEASRWIDAAISAVDPGTRLHADLLARAGMHASSRGDLPAAREACAAAADLYERLGCLRWHGHALIYLGIAHWGMGDYGTAARVHERASAVLGDHDDRWGESLALVLRARTAIDMGDPDAERWLQRATAVAQRNGDRHVVALAFEQWARAMLVKGRHDDAVAHARSSLRENETYGYREGVVASHNVLGLALLARGDVDQAAQHFREALTLGLRLKHPGSIAASLDGLAVVACRQGRADDGAVILAAGEKLRTTHHLQRNPTAAVVAAEALRHGEEHLTAEGLADARRRGARMDVSDVIALLAATPDAGTVHA